MTPWAPSSHQIKTLLAGVCLSCLQPAHHAEAVAQAPQPAFRGCLPLSRRTGENGCWIVLTQTLGQLPDTPTYWSLDSFPTRAAAEAGRGSNGIVTTALGEFWVFTLGPKGQWPAGGQHRTQIGPIPVKAGQAYTAQFMEAIMPPGVPTRTHRHPVAEAFYTEAGESCLETPQGKQVGRRGVDIIIPEGEPMNLLTSGTETRRSIVLVLHAADHAWMTMADDWTPKGLCKS